jgi:hypothetical protein
MTSCSGTNEFEGATFVRASFKGATLRFSDVSGVTMRSVDVDGLDIDSHDLFFGSLLVNGVDVVPLVDAELNRQFPGRELQKAQTPEGLREGWVAVQSPWQATVAGTPPYQRVVRFSTCVRPPPVGAVSRCTSLGDERTSVVPSSAVNSGVTSRRSSNGTRRSPLRNHPE